MSAQTAIVAANGTDGVNIEGYGTVEISEPQANLTHLVATLSAALRAQNPHAQVSMDAVGYPKNGFWWTGYDWPRLAAHVDFLVVMVYDLLNVDACSRGNCSLQGERDRGSRGSLEPPGPLLTHLHTVYMEYSECLPTRLNPLAERTGFFQVLSHRATAGTHRAHCQPTRRR